MTSEYNDPFAALSAPSVRAPRSLDTRATTEQRRSWVIPSTLPEIEPRDGWVHKWVRTDVQGAPDKKNFSSRMREGWEPIDIADYPELQSYSGGKTNGHAEVGGLIACRMPAEMVAIRNAHWRNLAVKKEADAEEHFMRDQNELMKKFNESSRKVVFGQSGR